MSSPKDLRIEDFTYELPEERIATFPLEKRDDAKLLVYKNGEPGADNFSNLHQHLPKGTQLVINDTRVVNARLIFKKETGGKVEVFCLNPDPSEGDVSNAFEKRGSVRWEALVGGAKKWKSGPLVLKGETSEGEIEMQAEKVENREGRFVLDFSWAPENLSFAEVLSKLGNLPLPPYLKREAEKADLERYQTVFANREGSVAAPTASLHFTPEVFEQLDQKRIQRQVFTLHVGAGTFKPVSAEKMADHEMHYEHFEVSKTFLENVLKNVHNPIVTVGTTSLRTLESLYWLAAKIESCNLKPGELVVNQWDPYELDAELSVKRCLEILIDFCSKHQVDVLLGKTQLLIAPGYSFKFANGLITNFHQPNSTLLLLVAAFVGEDWKKIYDFALSNEFRFLSYGDGSLLWRK
ncbi:S-adenosylmethionine:tRNA ribosyltransferase-isomerase [Halocola ammonii]